MESLRGQLLVAGPELLDPNFRRSVLLVGEHGEEGAMGVDPQPAVAGHGRATPCRRSPSSSTTTELVHVGGPGPASGDRRARRLPRIRARQRRSSSARSGFCRARSRRADDVGSLARARVFAGYAGWGPGQLESEIEEESWILEQALPEDVFTDEPDALWSAVLRRKGGPYAVLALMPPDPRRN